jgi:hypothetical protein
MAEHLFFFLPWVLGGFFFFFVHRQFCLRGPGKGPNKTLNKNSSGEEWNRAMSSVYVGFGGVVKACLRHGLYLVSSWEQMLAYILRGYID